MEVGSNGLSSSIALNNVSKVWKCGGLRMNANPIENANKMVRISSGQMTSANKGASYSISLFNTIINCFQEFP